MPPPCTKQGHACRTYLLLHTSKQSRAPRCCAAPLLNSMGLRKNGEARAAAARGARESEHNGQPQQKPPQPASVSSHLPVLLRCNQPQRSAVRECCPSRHGASAWPPFCAAGGDAGWRAHSYDRTHACLCASPPAQQAQKRGNPLAPLLAPPAHQRVGTKARSSHVGAPALCGPLEGPTGA